ncbi:hypothetical protein SAMN05421504_104139 [Amycolatopsis xylanica]|uniref:Uncharacterized protein n=1 Tax=Amycolatopsis xylanica TaxID=589385 RepID=A0A1H3G8B9_9PSEU|nr:DUF5947 family protein [Amycolatopsis xylanica]SDX98619.1 hypothetical protein SAMN05421504_104139 [Amycolatopsis xylanica]
MTEGLRRFLKPAPRAKPGERCEMCTDPISEEHGHVIDLESRVIMCTCRGCYLLFTHSGAGGKRHRAVPQRFLHAPDFTQAAGVWESIGIPVRMAFLFRNSVLDKTVAFYPSPAGATESLLPLGAWEELLAANTEFATVSPDVEALLLNKLDNTFECFLVPIDVCYELVGLVKLHWRGFDGGSEAWAAIDGFFADLRERSEVVSGG